MKSKFFLKLFTLAFFATMFIISCNPKKENNPAQEVDTIVEKEDTTIDLSKYNRYYNDMAKMMAGMDQDSGSELAYLDSNQMWQNHKKNFTELFSKVKNDRFAKMKEFSDNELNEVNKKSNTLFYPFSGPDFIHANIFFPDIDTTIMLGLERVGDVPDLKNVPDKRLGEFFDALSIALDSIFRLGYFMTYEMGKNFNRVMELNGVTPVIGIFMVQTGHRILDIERITIDQSGNIVTSLPGRKDEDDPKDSYISGVHFKYIKEGKNKIRHVFYFSHDVSNDHLAKTPQMVEFFRKQDIDITYFKAASYLCSWMDTIRNIALEESEYIFQDDSGIPLRYFNRNNWDMQFYGNYKRTLKVFIKHHLQPELRKIYETDTTVKPLDFGIGYGIRIRQTNLMLAKKKSNTQS